MTEQVINAVSAKLFRDFQGCTVYAEDVEQKLQKPCFTIAVRKESVRNFLGKRKLYRCMLCIHYISRNSSKKELNEVSDRLFQSLDFIQCVNSDVILHGNEMSSEISDNSSEINFYVSYSFTVYMEKQECDAEIMEELTTHFKSNKTD